MPFFATCVPYVSVETGNYSCVPNAVLASSVTFFVTGVCAVLAAVLIHKIFTDTQKAPSLPNFILKYIPTVRKKTNIKSKSTASTRSSHRALSDFNARRAGSIRTFQSEPTSLHAAVLRNLARRGGVAHSVDNIPTRKLPVADMESVSTYSSMEEDYDYDDDDYDDENYEEDCYDDEDYYNEDNDDDEDGNVEDANNDEDDNDESNDNYGDYYYDNDENNFQ